MLHNFRSWWLRGIIDATPSASRRRCLRMHVRMREKVTHTHTHTPHTTRDAGWSGGTLKDPISNPGLYPGFDHGALAESTTRLRVPKDAGGLACTCACAKMCPHTHTISSPQEPSSPSSRASGVISASSHFKFYRLKLLLKKCNDLYSCKQRLSVWKNLDKYLENT